MTTTILLQNEDPTADEELRRLLAPSPLCAVAMTPRDARLFGYAVDPDAQAVIIASDVASALALAEGFGGAHVQIIERKPLPEKIF